MPRRDRVDLKLSLSLRTNRSSPTVRPVKAAIGIVSGSSGASGSPKSESSRWTQVSSVKLAE